MSISVILKPNGALMESNLEEDEQLLCLESKRCPMFQRGSSSTRSFRMPCTIAAWVILLAISAPPPVAAQTGVIAFSDYCTRRLYAMRGDGSGRMALPLPQLPEPVAEHQYWDSGVLDVTASGPLTVVYYTVIARKDPLTLVITLVDFGLFAVHVDDVGGVLVPDPGPPVRLTLPTDVGFPGVNPNNARSGSFSPVRDRLALVAGSQAASVLMTAKVDRDESTLKITGLSDLVVVGDLYSLGLPDPNFPTSKAFTGDIDYSPDGSSIVASIYYHLWLVHLSAENTNAGVDLLTTNTDGFAEWKPSYSPDGTRIAYTAGATTTSGGVRSTDIYSLTLDTGAVTRVTSNKNKGDAASSRNAAMWSSDGTWIGFTASTRTPRNSPCVFVNSEVFLIRADGSNTASAITNTNGTSVEAWPKWGWVPK